MPWISRRRAHSHNTLFTGKLNTQPTLCLVLLATLALCLPAHASTWGDIARLEQGKGDQQATSAQTATNASAPGNSASDTGIQGRGAALPSHGGTVRPSPLLRLPSGLTVPAADWTVVLFMQSTCSYCQQFDPVLAQLSQQSGLPAFTYTLDGKGDAAFPKALPASPEVMSEFFGNGLPIATPTTFLVNVNTMATYPLLQGAVASDALLARLDEVLTFHYQQAPTSQEVQYAKP